MRTKRYFLCERPIPSSSGARACYHNCRYDLHLHEANYSHGVHVDYFRFGRVEKLLASWKKVSNPPPEANLGVGFFFCAPQGSPAEPSDLHLVTRKQE